MSDSEARDSKPDDSSEAITIRIRDQVRRAYCRAVIHRVIVFGLRHYHKVLIDGYYLLVISQYEFLFTKRMAKKHFSR